MTDLAVLWGRGDESTRSTTTLSSNITIGRSSGCAIRLNGWGVAKEHALMLVIDGQCYIRDLGGFGGVYVNGQRVRDFGPLSETDVIQIGNHHLRIIRKQPVTKSESDLESCQNDIGEESSKAQRPSVSQLRTRYKDRNSGFDRYVLDRSNHSVIETSVHHRTFEDESEPTTRHTSDGLSLRLPEPLVAATQSADQAGELASRVSWLRAAAFAELDRRGNRVKDRNFERLEDEFALICHDLLMPEQCRNATLLQLGEHEKRQLIRATIDECLGLGPIQHLMNEPAVSEIMVNGADSIFIETNGRLHRAAYQFSSEQSLRQVAERIAAKSGRRLDHAMPTMDARLPDGSRVNLVLPPLATKGTHITIRKFSRKLRRLHDLLQCNGATAVLINFLEWAVLNRLNILVSGGTGSGKTTLLNMLAGEIPHDQRVITIEDAAELQLDHPHCVSLESRLAGHEGAGSVTIRDLLRNALRMRPDRIMIGECRGGEALDLLQALNTGHGGSMSTIHANSPRDALGRLEVLTLLSGLDLPIDAIRAQISAAFHLVIQTKRYPDGRRGICSVSELSGLEGGRYRMQDLFKLNQGDCGLPPVYQTCLSTPSCIETLLDPAQGPWIDRFQYAPDRCDTRDQAAVVAGPLSDRSVISQDVKPKNLEPLASRDMAA